MLPRRLFCNIAYYSPPLRPFYHIKPRLSRGKTQDIEPAAVGEYRRAELRSPDPLANPYLAFALLIYAALDGLQNGLVPPPEANLNLFKADAEALAKFERLPIDLAAARSIAAESAFVQAHLPAAILDIYCCR